MAWETESTYYSGQGVVLLGDRDPATGKGDGFYAVGNVSALSVAIATSVIEHKESQSGARGIDLRLTTEIKATMTMTLENYDPRNLALALRGNSATVASGTVTDEALVFSPGLISPMVRSGVSALTVSKGVTPLILFVAGTATEADGEWDYKVNLNAGSIQWAPVPKTAALVLGDDLLADYSYSAQKTVGALTAAASEKYVRFEGLNTADGNKSVVVEAFRFLTDPLQELSLISDDIQSFALEGSVLLDALQPGVSKYFRQTLLD